MRKKLMVLFSVLLILSLSSSMICADTGSFTDQERVRGAGSSYIENSSGNVMAVRKTSPATTYYVTLTSINYRITGIPLTFTREVGANDLVFRPYTSADVSATNHVINFKYAIADDAGEFRESMSYGTPSCCQIDHNYKLKASLNSTSATDLFKFSGRFTP